MKAIEMELPHCIGEIQVVKDEKGKHTLSTVGLFPPSLSAFTGHFPNMPVLPAIVQLAAVRHIVEQYAGKMLLPKSFSRTKFRGMVSPDQQLTITLILDPQTTEYQGRFKFTDIHDKSISEGYFILQEA